MQKLHCNYADDGTINHRTQENLGVPRKGREKRNVRSRDAVFTAISYVVLTSWLLVLTVYAKNQQTSLGLDNQKHRN